MHRLWWWKLRIITWIKKLVTEWFTYRGFNILLFVCSPFSFYFLVYFLNWSWCCCTLKCIDFVWRKLAEYEYRWIKYPGLTLWSHDASVKGKDWRVYSEPERRLSESSQRSDYVEETAQGYTVRKGVCWILALKTTELLSYTTTTNSYNHHHHQSTVLDVQISVLEHSFDLSNSKEITWCDQCKFTDSHCHGSFKKSSHTNREKMLRTFTGCNKWTRDQRWQFGIMTEAHGIILVLNYLTC